MTVEQWPNRGKEVYRLAIAMAVVCMLSTIWRLGLRFRVSPWMGSSDWLMLAGTTLGFVCNIHFAMHGARNGLGRLKDDPFWTPERILTFNHLQFTSVCLQMYAIFLVKMSVCTYLLALDFSRRFKTTMWVVTLIVVTFNLVMPLILHFGYCRPYYHRWTPDVVPECWAESVRTVAEYAQIVSNIATDLVYASAPLVYLRQASLTKPMRLNVRIVFLLALVGTTSSVFKIIAMHRWLHSSEPFYDLAELAIWGINELSICIIVANLPMQRKSICNSVARILPEYLHSRLGLGRDTEYSQDEIRPSMFDSSRRTQSTTTHWDDGSEVAIIELENGRIVMAPKTPVAATIRENSSEGTLATFWNNDSKDSFS